MIIKAEELAKRKLRETVINQLYVHMFSSRKRLHQTQSVLVERSTLS